MEEKEFEEAEQVDVDVDAGHGTTRHAAPESGSLDARTVQQIAERLKLRLRKTLIFF